MMKLALLSALIVILLCGCENPTAQTADSTWLGEANPNPMRVGESTTISFGLKEGETGVVLIQNSLGQDVKEYSVGSGINSLTWNGRDEEGRLCASGVYYYILVSPPYYGTYKMLLLM